MQKIKKIGTYFSIIFIQSSLNRLVANKFIGKQIEAYKNAGVLIKDGNDIFEQSLIVAISLPLELSTILQYILSGYPIKLHELVIRAVLLSHVIDDYFDNTPLHYGELINLMISKETNQVDDKTYLIKNLNIAIGLTERKIHDYIISEIELIDGYIPGYNKPFFYSGLTKMVMAGLLQNYLKWSKKGNNHTFYKALKAYKQVNVSKVKSSSLKALWENRKLSWQVYISTASSLQEIFMSLSRQRINLDKLVAWNGILGPMVYLNNVKSEVVGRSKKMSEVLQKLSTSYMYFIDENWRYVRRHEEINDYQRLLQYYIGYKIMQKTSFTHSFNNFPKSLQTIFLIYNNIYMQINNKYGHLFKRSLTFLSILQR